MNYTTFTVYFLLWYLDYKLFLRVRFEICQNPYRNKHFILIYTASLVAQTVKNPPAMGETCVWSLGWKDSLQMGMETHSTIPAWRIPRTEEPGGLKSMGSQRVGQDWVTKHSTALTYSLKRFTLHLSLTN